MRLFAIFLIFGVLSGCASFQTASGNLRFEQYESLQKPGLDKDAIEKKIGKPDRITKGIGSNSAQIFEIWLYFDAKSKTPRLTLFFDPEDRHLLGANWYVKDADPVNTFSSFAQRYPETRFFKGSDEPGQRIVVGPKPAYSEFYENTNMGIFIGMSVDGEHMKIVSWRDPQAERQPATMTPRSRENLVK